MSSFASEPPCTSDDVPTGPPEGMEGAGAVAKVLQRHLRALRSGEARALDRATEEVFAVLDGVLRVQGGLVLRLAADGMYLQEHLVAELDPEQDEALFRLFRHGVRRIGFEAGIEEAEVASFLEVAATDFDRPEHVEDDVSTLLEDRGLAHVQVVVVETFVEGEGEARLGSFDLAAFVEAAVRPALREGEQLHAAGGVALPLWSADARFFRRADVADAIEALERQGERLAGRRDASGGVATGFRELVDELERSEASLAEWLIPDVLEPLGSMEEEAAERLADLLAAEVHRLAEAAGLTRVAPLVRHAVQWVAERLDLPVAVRFAEALFDAPLVRAVLRGLAAEEERAVALDLLHWFPEERAADLLEELLLRPPGALRGAALAVLVADSPSAQRTLARQVPRLDAEEGRAVLEAVLEADAEERAMRREQGEVLRPDRALVALMEALAVFESLPVQLRAMRWLAEHGGPMGRQVLARGLRAPEPFVRLAARYLLAAVRRREAAEVLAAHLQESSFDALPYEEKRLVTLLYAWLGGQEAAVRLRDALERSGALRREVIEERRAAAVVALGWLADEESAAPIFRLAQGRAGAEVVRREARLVVEAVEAGRAPCAHPREQLRSALRASGIGRWVARRRTGSGQVGASLLTGARRASAASKDAATVPPPPPNPRPAVGPPPEGAEGSPLSFSLDSLPAPAPLWSERREEP